MAQAKINGSTDWPMASNKPNFTSDENGSIPATLVIHEDKHERVFTESEVRAILVDFSRAKNDPGRFVKRNPHWWLGDWEKAAQDEAMKAHGIVLDPA